MGLGSAFHHWRDPPGLVMEWIKIYSNSTIPQSKHHPKRLLVLVADDSTSPSSGEQPQRAEVKVLL
jgi:hypothetical protein